MKAAQLPHPCLLPTVPPALCSAAWAWRLAPMSQSGGWRPTAYRWWCAATRCACPCSGQLIGWGCAADGRHLVGSALSDKKTRAGCLVAPSAPQVKEEGFGAVPPSPSPCCPAAQLHAHPPAAPQVKEEGFEVAHDGYTITVFSAPNYCDQMVRIASCVPLPNAVVSAVFQVPN